MVAALIDGVDMVAVGVPGPVAESTVRSLQARAREKGCILVPAARWPAGNVTLEVTGRRWEGLGRGSGRLRRQHLEVRASGRGAAVRPRTATITLGARAWPFPPADRETQACAPEPVAAPRSIAIPERRSLDEIPPGPELWAALAKTPRPKIERKQRWH